MQIPRGRRSKQNQSQSRDRSPFARYVCLEFAEHLRRTTSGRTAVSTSLYNFLDDNVLSWIEYVAAMGNLSILTRTATSINAYVQRHIQSSSPLGEFVYLTQNWVIDLHRIVAGFDPTLLTSPSAIYWLIPPFCPKSSAIVSTAASKFKHIAVEGLKDECWNDRMSCIDAHDKIASAVACGDTVFSVGHSTGSVILNHNSTCLPWKTLQHDSHVRQIVFDGSSTRLVSAGRRDIKVWDVESGFVVWTFDMSHDIMNIAITDDGRFATAVDKSNTFTSWNMKSGRLERTLNWSEKMPFPDEIGHRRPPLTAALSPDSSLIAILYRGRPICVYDLDSDMFHGLVSREGDPMAQGLGSMTSPSSIVFNTKKDNHTFVAAYEDGDLCLFDYEELILNKTIEEASAHLVACSPDGLTLLTGNSAGMVQLLEFDTLQLLYRVNAADYGIRGLSFSADNMRFVDVRGTQCNVWEPAVLLGLAKRDDSSTEPADWEPIMKGMDNEDLDITSIELEDSGQFFFVGRSDGSLSLCDTTAGSIRKVLYRHNYEISVTCMVWGSEKHVIASSDTACRFIICALRPDQEVGWKVAAKLMDRRADSVVLQLLLDPSNELLLVSTENSNSVWNFGTSCLIHTQTWQPSPSFTWINYPGSSAHRAIVTPTTISVLDWGSPIMHTHNESLTMPDHHGTTRANCVKNAFAFAHGSLLVVEFCQLYEERSTTATSVLKLTSPPSDDHFLIAATELGGTRVIVQHIIGGFDSRLLFVDSNRWVCSLNLIQGDARHYVRHFPIPSEWQSQQRRLIMAVSRNDDLLFVRTNEVAVIRHGLDFEERVGLGSR